MRNRDATVDRRFHRAVPAEGPMVAEDADVAVRRDAVAASIDGTLRSCIDGKNELGVFFRAAGDADVVSTSLRLDRRRVLTDGPGRIFDAKAARIGAFFGVPVVHEEARVVVTIPSPGVRARGDPRGRRRGDERSWREHRMRSHDAQRWDVEDLPLEEMIAGA